MSSPKVAAPTDNALENAHEKIARLEKKLAEQEYVFEQLVDEVNNGYWEWRIIDDAWYFSPGFCRFLDYDENSLPADGLSWKQLIKPAQIPDFTNRINILTAGKETTFTQTINLQSAQGQEMPVVFKGKVIEWDSNKKPTVVVGVVEEAASRQAPQDELHKQKELLGFTARSITGVNVFMFDQNLRYILAEGSDLLPGEGEQFLGKTLYELHNKREIKELEPIFQAALAGNQREQEITYRGGNYYAQFIPLPNHMGIITHGMVFAVNISQIKNVEYQLSTFIKQAPVAMAIVDTEMRYIAASRQWLEVYEIEGQSIIGKSHYEIFPETSQEWKEIHQECLKGEVKSRDGDRSLREDGTEQWIRWEMRPWHQRENKVGGLMMISEDITHRKISELELKRHQHGLKILTAISSNHQLSLNEQLQEVLLSVADYFDLPMGIISQIKDDNYTIEYAISREDELQIEAGTRYDFKNTYCSITYEQEDTVAIPSMIDSTYAAHPCYNQFKLETYIGSPIWVAGEKYGTINFSSPEKRLVNFTVEDIDFMRLVARWVGTTLERYTNEKQLVDARREAEEATQAKTDFLSTMSHEIRTPMNAVVGMAHLLLEEEPREDQVSSLETLKFSADLLLSLINDILDFSKIEAGKVTLESVDFNLKDLLQGIKSAQGIKAQEKQVKMKLLWDDDVPEMVIGDPVRIGQIINNLTSNAVKFTSQGGVIIEVELDKETEDQVQVVFKVQDTGIGIPTDKLAAIFEEFSQASSSTTREFGGTGLGLAITKKLLELQGSQIQVTSREGEGSTFFFALSLGKSQEKVADSNSFTTESSDEYMGSLRGARVLLVEDNYINQYVAARFIVKWQVDLDTADNGAEALKKVQQNTYDLILMDLQMPVVDGYEATKNIRAWQVENNKPTIPIIALTASATHSVKEKVISVGMNDFVSKPFVPKELFGRLQHHLVRRQVVPAEPSVDAVVCEEPSIITQQPDVHTTEKKSDFNFALLEELAEGDSNEMKELCITYEEMVQAFVADLHTFQETQDESLLGRSIHRVKSTFLLFGLEHMCQLLEDLSASEGQAKTVLLEKNIERCEALMEEILNYRQKLNNGVG
ncbi:MAG: ATP-binding protein [Cyclobacteriaceae bacterium]